MHQTQTKPRNRDEANMLARATLKRVLDEDNNKLGCKRPNGGPCVSMPQHWPLPDMEAAE